MVEIELGGHTIPVYPQPHAYLSNRIGRLLEVLTKDGREFSGEATSLDGFLVFAGDKVYDILDAAIPTVGKMIPRYEFAGFTSQSAMDAGVVDEEAQKKTPTIPQIRAAFEAAATVNGLDIIKHLSGVLKYLWGQLDPKLVSGTLNAFVAEWLSGTSLSMTSASSPPTSGESVPPSSGETSPTSLVSVA